MKRYSLTTIACNILIGMLLNLLPSGLKAQAPEKIHFQMTVKDFKKDILGNRVLGTRITIVNQDLDILYEEKQIVKTNSRGLASIDIGTGTERVGMIGDIDWNAGIESFYIRILIDPDGGTNYTLVSNTKLNPVPYAIQANAVESLNEKDPEFSKATASAISSENIYQWNRAVRERHYPGDLVGGGIVFYVDSTGEHGLLASTRDIASETVWMPSMTDLSDSESFSDGMKNTASIVQQTGEGDYAAYYCDTLTLNGKNDWYLPSIDELSQLFDSRYAVNKTLGSDNDDETEGIRAERYWTSTQRNADSAYLFYNGTATADRKENPAEVRAIRPFSGLFDARNAEWNYLGGPEKENGDSVRVIDGSDGNLLEDVRGKRGTVFRPTPEIALPAKITFNMRTTYNPDASEAPVELFGTGDFRLYFGGVKTGAPRLEMNESNLGEFEGVQFRIHPHLDESPIRRYTYNDGERESHTCTSIWMRNVNPDKRLDSEGLPHTGLVSDICQGRGNHCGWQRVGLFEDGFGLENGEETEVTIIISYELISIEVNGRIYTVKIADLEADDDYEGDILRFDTISNFAIGHTNISRGYQTMQINNFRVFPLNYK